MSPVEPHTNDASYVITGRVLDSEGTSITMARKQPTLMQRRVLGESDGHVGIADHWQEVPVPPSAEPMCMTLIHSPIHGGRYGVIVWTQDTNLTEACRELNLRPSLGVDVYGVGVLDPDVTTKEQARACCLALARMVANADLPWPPEDPVDHAKWMTAAALVDSRTGG